MKTLEQEVLKKIAKKSLFVKLVNTERNESLVEQSISKEFFLQLHLLLDSTVFPPFMPITTSDMSYLRLADRQSFS